MREFKHALEPSNLAMIRQDPEAQRYCLAQQMLMGQGKTAIIMPLLVLIMADGERLPILLLPESLLSGEQASERASECACVRASERSQCTRTHLQTRART